MDSMLKPKPSNDPQDIPVVAPDAIRVAPADEAPSDPIRDLMRGGSLEPQIHAETDFPAADLLVCGTPPVLTGSAGFTVTLKRCSAAQVAFDVTVTAATIPGATLTLTVAPLLLSSIGLLAAIVAARRVLRNDPAATLRGD